jgi:hypothetical protein
MSVPRKRRRLVSDQQKKSLPLDDQIDLARGKDEENDPLEGMTEEELDNLIRNLDWSSDKLDDVNVGEVKKYMRSKKFREEMRKAKLKLDKTNKDIKDANDGWFAANVAKGMVVYGVSFTLMLGALTKFNLWVAPSLGLEGMSFMEAVFISMSQTTGFMVGGPMGFVVSSGTSYGLAGGFRLGNFLADFVDGRLTRSEALRAFRRLFPEGPPPELEDALSDAGSEVSDVSEAESFVTAESLTSSRSSFGDMDSRGSFSDFGEAPGRGSGDSVDSFTRRMGSESSFSSEYSDASRVSAQDQTDLDYAESVIESSEAEGELPPDMRMSGDSSGTSNLAEDDVIFGETPREKNLYADDLEEDDGWGDYTDDEEEAGDWGESFGEPDYTAKPAEPDMVGGVDIEAPPVEDGWVRILDRPSYKSIWVREGTSLEELDSGTREMLENLFKKKYPGEALPETVVSEMNGIAAPYRDIGDVKAKLRSFGVSTEGTPKQLRARILHLDQIDDNPVGRKWLERRQKIIDNEPIEDLDVGEGMDGPHDIYDPDFGDVADVGKPPPVGGAPPTARMSGPTGGRRTSFAESAIPPKSQNVASESSAGVGGGDIPVGTGGDIPETGGIGDVGEGLGASGEGLGAAGEAGGVAAGIRGGLSAAGGTLIEAAGPVGVALAVGLPLYFHLEGEKKRRQTQKDFAWNDVENSNKMVLNARQLGIELSGPIEDFVKLHPETEKLLVRNREKGWYDYDAFYGKSGVPQFLQWKVANKGEFDKSTVYDEFLAGDKGGSNQGLYDQLEKIRNITHPWSGEGKYVGQILRERDIRTQAHSQASTNVGADVGWGLLPNSEKLHQAVDRRDSMLRNARYQQEYAEFERKQKESLPQLLEVYKQASDDHVAALLNLPAKKKQYDDAVKAAASSSSLSTQEKDDLVTQFDKAKAEHDPSMEGHTEVIDEWRRDKERRSTEPPDVDAEQLAFALGGHTFSSHHPMHPTNTNVVPDQELIDAVLRNHHLADHPLDPKNSAPKDDTEEGSMSSWHAQAPTGQRQQYKRRDEEKKYAMTHPNPNPVDRSGIGFVPNIGPKPAHPLAGMAQHSGGIGARVGQGGGEVEVEEPIHKQHRATQNPSLAVNNIRKLPAASDRCTRVTGTLNDPVTTGALPSRDLYSDGTRAPADTGERQARPGSTFSTQPHLGPVGGGSSVFHTHDPEVAAPSYGHSLTSTKGYKANVVEQVAPGENTHIGQPPVNAPKAKFTIHDLRSIYAMDKSIPNFTILAQTANQNFMHSMMETSQLQ